jgi:hypothetical protein
MFSMQNVSPQESGQGGTEGCTESTVVDPHSHSIDRTPKGSIGDWYEVVRMDVLPGLDDA